MIRGLTRDFLHAYAIQKKTFIIYQANIWHITQEVSERHPSALKEENDSARISIVYLNESFN